MVDSIQRTSSVAIPEFQTGEGQKDPLPLDAPKERARTDERMKATSAQGEAERFEAYLNQTSISTLEKNQQAGRFDPAREITADSPYGQPAHKAPI